MAVVRRHIADGAVTPSKLGAQLSDSSYVFEKFNYSPRLSKLDGYSAPTGVANDTDLMVCRRLNTSYHIKGTQTILGPSLNATTGALQVQQDAAVADDGVEHLFGQSNTAANPLGITIGSASYPFTRFARLKFNLSDVSGTDDCAFGWRKFQTSQANIDDYTDMNVLNVITGNVKQETILNNAATVTSAALKTWADGETHEIKVTVAPTGVSRCFFDGIEVGAPFTFDSTDALVPFFFFLQDTDICDTVEWYEFECGAEGDVDDAKAQIL